MQKPKIFDGHNDLLARLWLADDEDPSSAFLHSTLTGQMDWERCQKGHLIGGLFAIFVPPFEYVKKNYPHKINATAHQTTYTMQQVEQICFAQMSYLLQIEEKSAGKIKICRTFAEINACIANGIFAVVMHIEGAEVLDTDFHLLDIFYAAGLRSIGALWNMPNQFGHGLNAPFPHSPDTGHGLTGLGKELIQYCQHKRLVVDVSHMNEKAFWDTANILQQPIVATHSNVHEICPQARNLTNMQLEEIASSKGFVGVNLDTAFLREDGKRNAETPFDILIRHFDHLIEYLGEDHVGFGSDYDGGFMSNRWADISCFPKIIDKLSAHGYSDDLIDKISHRNWLSVLENIWGK